ncbi:MAG: hypothetical protein KGJ08_01995 [Gammaproteobacteria bacterium]|nr:hypothetical protein [Gammaproteobacteria bacterium]
MNKYVIVLSAAVLGLALSACGNSGQESTPAAAPAAPAASTAMAAPAAGTAMKAPAAATGKPASPTPQN